MQATVLHQPRVAWEVSRILVDAARSDTEVFAWYRDRVAKLLGTAYRQELLATRDRLANPQRDDALSVETARWRARLEDALHSSADLTEDLYLLLLDARSRQTPARFR